jgi:hypothetical protein
LFLKHCLSPLDLSYSASGKTGEEPNRPAWGLVEFQEVTHFGGRRLLPKNWHKPRKPAAAHAGGNTTR